MDNYTAKNKRFVSENEQFENQNNKRSKNTDEIDKLMSPTRKNIVNEESLTPKTTRSLRRTVLTELSPNTNVNKKLNLDFSPKNWGAEINKESGIASLKTPSPNAPVTPTTNFRLLTSLAASLSYANDPDRTIKLPNRRLILTDETNTQTETITETVDDANISNDPDTTTTTSQCHEPTTECFSSSKFQMDNVQQQPQETEVFIDQFDEHSHDSSHSENSDRKKKSLGLLCERFLRIFPEYPIESDKVVFNLIDVSEKLGVPKRRMYDITCILSCLNVIEKRKKSMYQWMGKTNLIETLKQLRQRALQLKQSVKLNECIEMESYSNLPIFKNVILPPTSRNDANEDINNVVEGTTTTRKDKGLAETSRRFLMLFLESPETRISLEVASKVLNEETSRDASKLKTRVRRLYDIANVLQSLSLIQKAYTNDLRGRKSAFIYSGPLCWDLTQNSVENNALPTSVSSSTITSEAETRMRSLQNARYQTSSNKRLRTVRVPKPKEQCPTTGVSVVKNVKKSCNDFIVKGIAHASKFVTLDVSKSAGLNTQGHCQIISIPYDKYEEIINSMGIPRTQIQAIKFISTKELSKTPLINSNLTEPSVRVDSNETYQRPIEKHNEITSSELLETESNSVMENFPEIAIEHCFDNEELEHLECYGIAEEIEVQTTPQQIEIENAVSSINSPKFTSPVKYAHASQSCQFKTPGTPIKKRWVSTRTYSKVLPSPYVLPSKPYSPIYTTTLEHTLSTLPEIEISPVITSSNGTSKVSNGKNAAVARCLKMSE